MVYNKSACQRELLHTHLLEPREIVVLTISPQKKNWADISFEVGCKSAVRDTSGVAVEEHFVRG